jgi:hypothetical protein
VFIDAGIQTQETLNKWKMRRALQVKKAKLDVPNGLATIYGDMWKELGIRVHYSDIDNDDTIAAWAQHNGASVLSGDKDMYRYLHADFVIYSNFEIDHGYLVLEESKSFWHPKPRKLPEPLPRTFTHFPVVERLKSSKEYMKGCPSALTKYVGNLHLLCRPLRQAFYHIVGVDFDVKESFIEWNELKQEAYWTKEKVSPDPTLAHIIYNLPAALHYYIP